MSLVYAYRGKGISHDIVIVDRNGNTITPGGSDLVRATIGHQGQTAKLTVTSGTPTANGSSFTKGSTNRLRLDASDLSFPAGTYNLDVELFDHSDAAEWKLVSRQVFCLEEDIGS